MRSLPWFALLGLAACHQTLPSDDDSGGSSTGPSMITMPMPETSTTATPTTTMTPTSTGEDSTSTGTTEAVDPSTSTTTGTTDGETTVATTGETTAESTGGTTLVPVCGDGVAEGDEQCDLGDDNDDLKQGGCREDCRDAGCGDGVVDFILGEQCDDENAADGDGCSAGCAIEAGPNCGDGKVDLVDGEICDDGNNADGDGCSGACQFDAASMTCGDGTEDAGEACDDSNADNGDACNPTCTLKNTTTLFAGTPGVAGTTDGVGPAAKLGGLGAMVVVGPHLYLADGINDSIRQIDIATGTVVTIAGSINGTPGYSDGPNGLMARFNDVETITTDGTTLYVGDRLNRRLRGVSLTPPYAVTTLAGSGQQGWVDGPGPAALVDDIRGLTYYKGVVYMVDAGSAVLRTYDVATGEVTTIAGMGYDKKSVDGVGLQARFTGPRHMTTDNSGLLYIADSDGFALRTYHTTTKYVGTLIGTGAKGYVDGDLTTAQLSRPRGLFSDGNSVYFGEFDQHTVRQVVLATQTVSTNIGTHCMGMPMCMGGYMEGVGAAALLNTPFEVAYDHASASLFVLDSGNKVIRRVQ